jgi:hypothetical protein
MAGNPNSDILPSSEISKGPKIRRCPMFTKKSSSGMLTIFISLIGVFFLSLAVPQTGLGLNLYDDFSSPAINTLKWQEYEFAREIQNGQLLLKVRSSVNTTGIIENALSFQDPASINSIEAKVTPLAFNNPQGAKIDIFMGGRFFNAGGGTPGTYTGDVFATLSIGGSGTSPVATWFVIRYTANNTSVYDVIGSGAFTLTPELGTQYTAFVGWNEGSKQFTFRISDGVTTEEKVFTTVLTVAPANMPMKFLYERISNNVGLEASVEALFDDVKTNGSASVYDDFSADIIDVTKWQAYYDLVRDVDNGALRLMRRTSTADTGAASSYALQFANPELIKTMQAQVTPLAYSNPNGLDTKANISGRYYNDGTLNGYQGDVIAGVGIGGTGASPFASWTLRRHTDPTDSSLTEPLATGDFSTTITLGTPYTLFVSWDGAGFIFKVNDEVATYVPGTVHPPNYPMRRLQARTLSAGGQESLIEATYDNVMVELETYPGTYGTQITFAGPGFGSKKGKVLIGGLAQKVGSWSDTSITVIVNKYKDLVTDAPYDVSIQPKEPKGAPPINPGGFTLKKPEIEPISTASGSSGDEITINGMWFGTKKGTVYVGDQKCKVTSWTMNPTTGISTLTFVVHKKLGAGKYFLEVANKIGRSLSFGFEVK